MTDPKEQDEQVQDVEETVEMSSEAGAEDANLSETEVLQRNCDQLQLQLDRAKADLANFRKRQYREVETARNLAIEGMTTEILPVLDNFHLALSAHEQQGDSDNQQDSKAMIEGLQMVKSLLVGVLERHGIAQIAAENANFDPNLHEAVGIDPETELAPGKVSRVVQQGYTLAGKVLRASRVMVSGDNAQPTSDAGEA